MAEGVWVIMFPEGTRIARGQVGEYKTGGTRLAIAAGVPVIPVAVTSGRCWPRKAFIKRPGVVDISIGKPIPTEGRQADELMAEVRDWIEAEMRRLDPEVYEETALAALDPDWSPALRGCHTYARAGRLELLDAKYLAPARDTRRGTGP